MCWRDVNYQSAAVRREGERVCVWGGVCGTPAVCLLFCAQTSCSAIVLHVRPIFLLFALPSSSVFLLFLHTSVFSPGSDIHHELRSSAVRVAVAPECQVKCERAGSLYLDE